jgi:hypothetical protein
MPTAARATGCADFTLPLTLIGPALVGLVSPPVPPRLTLSEGGSGG